MKIPQKPVTDNKTENKTEKKTEKKNTGSVYGLEEVENINGQYVRTPEDVVIYEYNEDKIAEDTVSVAVSKDSEVMELEKGKDYSVMLVGSSRNQKIYKYVINRDVFSDDAEYSVFLRSEDEAGNINQNEAKESPVSFSVDNTAPLIISCSPTAVQEEQGVRDVRIKDNDSLDEVEIYVMGEKVDFSSNGEIYSFRIPENVTEADVKVVARDRAGNTYERMLVNYVSAGKPKLKSAKSGLSPVFMIIFAAIMPAVVMILRKRLRKDRRTCSRHQQ